MSEGEASVDASASGEGTANAPADAGLFSSAPDWLPEKFRVSSDSGDFNAEESFQKVTSSYSALEKQYSAGKDGMRADLEAEIQAKAREGLPESPEAYELVLPSVANIMPNAPEGMELQLDEADPMLAFWRNTAHQAGLSQDQFNEGIKNFVATQVSDLPDSQAELAKLGENAQERVDRLERKIAATVPEATYDALVSSLKMNAGLVEALEHITEHVQDPGPGAFEGLADGKLSEESIKEMMRDRRYLDNDREWHAKIADAWKTLAAQQSRGA